MKAYNQYLVGVFAFLVLAQASSFQIDGKKHPLDASLGENLKSVRPSLDGRTELMKAIIGGAFGMVQFLCETNNSVDYLWAKDNDGVTALMYAILCKNFAAVQLLCETNNVSKHLLARDREGKTALMYAIDSENIEAAKLLCQINNSKTIC